MAAVARNGQEVLVPQTKQEEVRSILVAVDDMFFASKIRGTAESLGVPVTMIRSASAAEKALESGTPSLIIIDLNSERLDPLGMIRVIKSTDSMKFVPIVGFLSHVQVDLKLKAEEAGCDRVMARSQFTQRLPEILKGGD